MTQVKRQKRGSDDDTSNKCEYIDEYSHRKCGLQVRRGMKYCFAHLNKMEGDDKAEDRIFRLNRKGEKVYRVKCPVDPSHTIWADKLKSHLGKCNVVKERRAILEKEKNCDWFELNCNVKGEKLGDMKLTDESIDYEYFKDFISQVLVKYDIFFNDRSELPLDQVIYKEGLEGRFEEVNNRKHLTQQSSLIGQLVKHGLFGRSNLYVEFGCGRSEFSRYLNRAIDAHEFGSKEKNEQPCRYLMIDRDSPRMKMDRKIIEDSIIEPEVHRLKVDIKDLKLSAAMKQFGTGEERDQSFVGISKHLCGVATDLTLRCLVNTTKDLECPVKFKGFLVAMCCRHCCYYPWLLEESKQFLKDNFGIDEENFKYLRKMCPWATSGTGRGEGSEHFSGLSLEEREQVGLKMRRILDTARCFAMREKGFKVELVRYVGREVTFENTCMVINV